EQPRGTRERAPIGSWDGRQEVHCACIKPAEHVIDRMPCLMGVAVLVAKPSPPAAFVQAGGCQARIEKIERRAKLFESPPPPQSGKTGIAVVEPDQNQTTGLNLAK